MLLSCSSVSRNRIYLIAFMISQPWHNYLLFIFYNFVREREVFVCLGGWNRNFYFTLGCGNRNERWIEVCWISKKNSKDYDHNFLNKSIDNMAFEKNSFVVLFGPWSFRTEETNHCLAICLDNVGTCQLCLSNFSFH